jgi:DNA ligase-4
MSRDDLSQLQVWFVAFDILYDGDHSVIDRPLHERHKILLKALGEPCDGQSAVEMTPPGAPEPVFGAIKLLMPEDSSSESFSLAPGLRSQPVSVTALAQLDELMQGCVEREEEGVVLKNLDSEWQEADRSDAWIKFKPDYRHTEDLDLLIIGAFNGTGWRGGKMSMFLLAVAEKPHGGGDPCVFHSFCRVGTGLMADDLDFLQKHFESRMVPGGRGKQPPCYKVTGSPISFRSASVRSPANCAGRSRRGTTPKVS